MPPEPRDTAFVEEIASTVAGLHLAIERGAPGTEVVGLLAQLVNAMIKHRDALPDRPGDTALWRAVGRL